MPFWQHAIVTNCPSPALFVELKDGSTVFPLYLYPPSEAGLFSEHESRRPNLNRDLIETIEARIGLNFIEDGKGDLEKDFGPEDFLHYVYALFYSSVYRSRYFDLLRAEFPRVPITSDSKQFRRLSDLGGELVSLHLLESRKLDNPITSYPVGGENEVEKSRVKHLAAGEAEPGTGKPIRAGRAYINAKQYFEGVTPEVWNMSIGGYQVCEKWLKDRDGRSLDYDDIQHYQKIVTALSETRRLMQEIDAAIPTWPIQ
jgi:hypothetical protein